MRKGSDDRPGKHPGISEIFKSFAAAQPPSNDVDPRQSDDAVVMRSPPTGSVPHAPASSVLQLKRIETEYSQKSPWSPETPGRDEQILGLEDTESKALEDECDEVDEDVIRLNSTDNNKRSIINMV